MCYNVHEGGRACHERVAVRVRIYVPMSCRYIRARCGRFGRLSRANERSDSNRRHEPSLSTSTVHATAGRTAAAARCAVHRRRAPRAPPCRKALSVGQKWRELEFLTLRISQNCRYRWFALIKRGRFVARRKGCEPKELGVVNNERRSFRLLAWPPEHLSE